MEVRGTLKGAGQGAKTKPNSPRQQELALPQRMSTPGSLSLLRARNGTSSWQMGVPRARPCTEAATSEFC